MKKLTLLLMVLFFLGSCKNNTSNQSSSEQTSLELTTSAESVEPTADYSELIKNKGIGPIKSLNIAPTIDQEMAKKGQQHFKMLCSTCHKPAKKFIGPAPKDILKRRSPEWVMNIMMNPEEMLQKDPIAMQLLQEFNGVLMPNQNISEQQAREILEYFRTIQ